jgi:hypothetical protein
VVVELKICSSTFFLLLFALKETKMFRRNVIKGLSAYAMFMKETKNHPNLRGLAVPKRGRELAKLYSALSPAEKDSLKIRAAAIAKKPNATAKAPKTANQKRAPTKYNLFVKQQMRKYEGSAPQRMRMIAAAWRNKQ